MIKREGKIEDLTEFAREGNLEITLDDRVRNLHGLVGLKVGEDGRIWICFEGRAMIRFKPDRSVS